MEVKFRTLTPVFTGDRKKESLALRDSGLIGSLRFWAGAIARGLGYKIKTDRAHFEVKKRDDADHLDPVTRIFGCTGWRRVFRQTITAPTDELPQSPRVDINATNHGWRLTPGCMYPWNDTVAIDYHFRRPLSPQYEQEAEGWLYLTWYLIHCLAGMGAHQGWGYGQIRLAQPKLSSIALDNVHEIHDSGYPDLADFVFAEYEFGDKPTLKCLNPSKPYFQQSPSYDSTQTPVQYLPVGLSLRYRLHHPGPVYTAPPLRNWGPQFFGDSNGGVPAGRFHGSFIYRADKYGNPKLDGKFYRFRVWAWLPKSQFDGSHAPLPGWTAAAKLLQQELQNPDLWQDIAGCKRPTECYFWPLTPADTITKAQSSCIAGIAPILHEIENRARTIPGRAEHSGETL